MECEDFVWNGATPAQYSTIIIVIVGIIVILMAFFARKMCKNEDTFLGIMSFTLLILLSFIWLTIGVRGFIIVVFFFILIRLLIDTIMFFWMCR